MSVFPVLNQCCICSKQPILTQTKWNASRKKRAVTELMYLLAETSAPQQLPVPSAQECKEEQAPPTKRMTLVVPMRPSHQSQVLKMETELATYQLTPVADPDADLLQW